LGIVVRVHRLGRSEWGACALPTCAAAGCLDFFGVGAGGERGKRAGEQALLQDAWVLVEQAGLRVVSAAGGELPGEGGSIARTGRSAQGLASLGEEETNGD
jgi:hypothetical protein